MAGGSVAFTVESLSVDTNRDVYSSTAVSNWIPAMIGVVGVSVCRGCVVLYVLLRRLPLEYDTNDFTCARGISIFLAGCGVLA